MKLQPGGFDHLLRPRRQILKMSQRHAKVISFMLIINCRKLL